MFIWILTVLVIGVILVSLIYTVSVGRTQKALKGEYDTQINENVQNHPYLRNPIFLAIAIFFIFVLGYILYWSLK
ncbi:hypothetical protein ELQ35_07965 [Peribacillus cavernae]|uniref:Uncharacterized protein n=1 Tax=Peribacillus cavernae TaxID=1674310 RepID=A0A3S0W1D3_9BACI|nr:hypothetical protein ELQ35_07965 [Peribacillus cavernae]